MDDERPEGAPGAHLEGPRVAGVERKDSEVLEYEIYTLLWKELAWIERKLEGEDRSELDWSITKIARVLSEKFSLGDVT